MAHAVLAFLDLPLVSGMHITSCTMLPSDQAAANEGQTKPPELDEVVSLHFVALVERDGQLWELDGRKSGPVPHGPTSQQTLLQVRRRMHFDLCKRHCSVQSAGASSFVLLNWHSCGIQGGLRLSFPTDQGDFDMSF